MPTRALLFTVLLTAPLAARADDLMVLLEQRKCRQCQLADVDLVHANLRDADLGNAKLMRANLSQAQLDGANLSGADLSFTSLRGASLHGANLTGSRLYGTDLREADLSGAQLSPKALEVAHWQRAKGIANGTRSHALLHNAGVEAFQAGRWHEVEQLFGAAIDIGRMNHSVGWLWASAAANKPRMSLLPQISAMRQTSTGHKEQMNGRLNSPLLLTKFKNGALNQKHPGKAKASCTGDDVT